MVDASSGVVKDEKTGLEWYAGTDEDTSWYDAKKWVENPKVAGRGWRLPNSRELKTLFIKESGGRNLTPLLQTTGWYIYTSEPCYRLGLNSGSDCNDRFYHSRAIYIGMCVSVEALLP
ncbi:DUF1566 domain-containing protein [Thermodesulfobacteriota bacterium]